MFGESSSIDGVPCTLLRVNPSGHPGRRSAQRGCGVVLDCYDRVLVCDCPTVRSLGVIDERLSAAVEARSEIDLRLGCAFTRFQVRANRLLACVLLCDCDAVCVHLQTLSWQKLPGLDKLTISYGPCQFPTLGFIVDRCVMHAHGLCVQLSLPCVFIVVQISRDYSVCIRGFLGD